MRTWHRYTLPNSPQQHGRQVTVHSVCTAGGRAGAAWRHQVRAMRPGREALDVVWAILLIGYDLRRKGLRELSAIDKKANDLYYDLDDDVFPVPPCLSSNAARSSGRSSIHASLRASCADAARVTGTSSSPFT